jgi:hypothetical protein
MRLEIITPLADKDNIEPDSLRCKYKLKAKSGKIIDPIALACWMYEYGKKDTSIFSVFNSVPSRDTPPARHSKEHNILELLKSNHFETAQKIRDYYSQKFLMISMKSQHTFDGMPSLSKFRTELMQYFVESKNNQEYTDDQIGMIYSLPRLYNEDQLLDKLRENYNINAWRQKEPNGIIVRKTLFYIDVNRKRTWLRAPYARTHPSNRQDEFFNYWFHDENDRLYCIDLEMDNPFCRIWSRLIEFPMEVEGKIYKNTAKDNLNYYTFNNWEILEEF